MICRSSATWNRTAAYLCSECRERWAEPWPVPGHQPHPFEAPAALVAAWKALWEAGGPMLEAAIQEALRGL